MYLRDNVELIKLLAHWWLRKLFIEGEVGWFVTARRRCLADGEGLGACL